MVQSNVVESNASPTSDDASTSSTGRKKLRFLFVETLKHSLSNSAVNALPSIGREKNWYVKIFWLILFFAGMVLSTNCNIKSNENKKTCYHAMQCQQKYQFLSFCCCCCCCCLS